MFWSAILFGVWPEIRVQCVRNPRRVLVASSLLSGVLVACWIASQLVFISYNGERFSVHFAHGRISGSTNRGGEYLAGDGLRVSFELYYGVFKWRRGSGLHMPRVYSTQQGGVGAELPFWLPLVLGITVVVFVYALGLQTREGPSCHKCDYDLTGNVSGRCPECGVPVTKNMMTRRTRAKPTAETIILGWFALVAVVIAIVAYAPE